MGNTDPESTVPAAARGGPGGAEANPLAEQAERERRQSRHSLGRPEGAAGQWSEESSSPEETEAAGARLAARLRPGDVVTVSGELGAGKTTFVRGAARALGVTGPVTSPTYTVGHRYRGRVDVSHLDLYRFVGVSDAEWGDLEPYFVDAVAFVEWPEAAGPALGPVRAAVRLAHRSEAVRSIEVREC